MFMRNILVLLLLFVMNPSVLGESPQEPGRGRIMPPAALECDRNDLTSYDGRILSYRRRKGSTYLRIRTNYDTTEAVTIRHPGTSDTSKFYLINGEPFERVIGSELSEVEVS